MIWVYLNLDYLNIDTFTCRKEAIQVFNYPEILKKMLFKITSSNVTLCPLKKSIWPIVIALIIIHSHLTVTKKTTQNPT